MLWASPHVHCRCRHCHHLKMYVGLWKDRLCDPHHGLLCVDRQQGQIWRFTGILMQVRNSLCRVKHRWSACTRWGWHLEHCRAQSVAMPWWWKSQALSWSTRNMVRQYSLVTHNEALADVASMEAHVDCVWFAGGNWPGWRRKTSGILCYSKFWHHHPPTPAFKNLFINITKSKEAEAENKKGQ